MRCLNVNGGSNEQTFSQTYTLAKGNCNGNYATVGCDTFAFEWDQGCYGANGRGYYLSTSDLDQDSHTGNCAAGGNSLWPNESGGWGWHNSCGCGGIYKHNGKPMCMGDTETAGLQGCTTVGCGYQINHADRVEMWLMVT